MSLHHQKLREIIFLLLYARSQDSLDEKGLEEMIMEQLKVSKSNVLKSLEYVHRIESKLSEIDDIISKLAHSYDFERIQSIEKTALRLGAYELIYNAELPPKIVIAEALRLTKKFGSPAAVSFVNAILDNLLKRNENG